MSDTTLISAAALQAALTDSVNTDTAATAHPAWVLLDCSFDLADTAAGQRAHAEGHLPGAHYAHLDHHLSGLKSGSNGRHPLPTREAWAAAVAGWGIRPGVQVVVYDSQGMPFAARAWWLLRWLGHREVAVLDGGKAAWVAAGGALQSLAPAQHTASASAPGPAPAPYPEQPVAMATITADELQSQLAAIAAGALRLFDARPAERFHGQVEPLDAVAGHIPGATLRCFKDNLQPDARFKTADQLRAEFLALGADPLASGHATLHQCGSGVTACHNLLAMAHAGLGEGVLYPGSWSEWSSQAARPMVRGDDK